MRGQDGVHQRVNSRRPLALVAHPEGDVDDQREPALVGEPDRVVEGMNQRPGDGDAAAKAWKDIWGCGQGIGAIREVVPAAALVAQFKREYAEAKARICAGE